MGFLCSTVWISTLGSQAFDGFLFDRLSSCAGFYLLLQSIILRLTANTLNCYISTDITIQKRKLSYRKDDRATYGCPENFRESLTMPKATFRVIFNGFLFLLSL